MKKLYKTTIVIWSDTDPRTRSLAHLADSAECGDSYCSKQNTVIVENPESDQDWDGTEFFGTNEDDDK